MLTLSILLQVSDPVAVEFSLNTQMFLLSKRSLWLSDGSMGFGQESDVAFSEGKYPFASSKDFIIRAVKITRTILVIVDVFIPLSRSRILQFCNVSFSTFQRAFRNLHQHSDQYISHS